MRNMSIQLNWALSEISIEEYFTSFDRIPGM